jgi:hypothetical protein
LLDPDASSEDEFRTRFSSYVTELTRMLGRTPSWQLATSLLALHSPTRYLCVHTTSLGRQRTWLGDSPIRSRKPNAIDYQKALKTSARIQHELQELGLTPVDLLDVYDFMRTSTTPSAMRRLEALRQSTLRGAASEQPEQPPADEQAAAGERKAKPQHASEEGEEQAQGGTVPPASNKTASEDDVDQEAA